MHCLLAAILGARAGDTDLDVLEMRLEFLGPGTVLGRIPKRGERLAAGAFPTIATELGERAGNRPLHHHRDVVPRAVGPAAGASASRIGFAVLPRVPTTIGHVDPPANCEPVVDHRDLLMVAATDRVGGVELEIDPAMRKPANEVEHHRSARQELERTDSPLEDTDFQPLV